MAKRLHAISPKEVEPEYQTLAARMNFGGSLYLPRIFKKAFTLEQARVIIELNMSSDEIASILGISKEEAEKNAAKYQVEAIAKKLNLDKKTVERHIQYAFELGFAFSTRGGWRLARSFGQLRDSMTNPKFDEQLGDEFFDLWKAYERLEAYPAMIGPKKMSGTEPQAPSPFFRAIPARKSLKNIPNVVPEDNLEEILKKASRIAVVNCACKRLVRDRDPNIPVEVCIIMDNVAEHNIRRGTAKVISIEEALAIQEMANDAGLISFPQGPRQVCHCHWSCCGVIAPFVMTGRPLQELLCASCYRPVVDPDKCTGCQTCVTRCQFEAIDMIRYPGAGKQEKLKAWVDPEKCRGCGLCVIKCPVGARTMVQVKTGVPAPADSSAELGVGVRRGKDLETNSLMTRPL
jgi:NAD-dependent dihydropyrimidine dehydrogenase PreA subunit